MKRKRAYHGVEAEVNRRVIWRDTLPDPPKMRAVWVMVVVCRFVCMWNWSCEGDWENGCLYFMVLDSFG